ncbi:hypothetical protein NMG60_11036740 [Bertholletia excelsa]
MYSSIENLDEEYLGCKQKEILLHPRSAIEVYARNLKIDLLANEKNKYYVCTGSDCEFLSFYQTASCRCGNHLGFDVNLSHSISPDEGVFVKSTARFMITDDLRVLPLSTMTGLSMLGDIETIDGIEERTLHIGEAEVVKLLKCSLTSNTPLSDALLEPSINKTIGAFRRVNYGPRITHQSPRDKSTTSTSSEVKFKLIIHKPKNRVLYAEVEENFVNVLCSFFAIPIGYVFKEYPCLSFKGCMGNLYKTILNPDIEKFFKSEEMKETLVNPKLAPGLTFVNKLTGIEEAEEPSLDTVRSIFSVNFTVAGEAEDGDGFLKGPSMFMVTENLSIAPLSPISGISLINRLKIPPSDIREMEMIMGEEEALLLLAASIASKFPLTDAFLRKEPKQET